MISSLNRGNAPKSSGNGRSAAFGFYAGNRLLDGLISIGRGEAQLFTDGRVVLRGELGGVFNGHLSRVLAVDQDLIGYLAGSIADVIVADGQRGYAAALADALLTGDDGSAGCLLYTSGGLAAAIAAHDGHELALLHCQGEVLEQPLLCQGAGVVDLRDVPYFKQDRKSTRLNSSHSGESRMPSSA